MDRPGDPSNPSDGCGVKDMAFRFETASQHTTTPLQQRPLDPVLTLAPRKPVKVAVDDVLAAAAAQPTPTLRSLDPVLSTSSRPPVKVAAEAVVAAGSRRPTVSRSLDPVLASTLRQPVRVTAEAVLTLTPPLTPTARKIDSVLSSSSRPHVKVTAAHHETLTSNYQTQRYVRRIPSSRGSDCSSPPSSSSFSDRSSICSVSSSNFTSPPTSNDYLSPLSSLGSMSDMSKSFESSCEGTEDESNCLDDEFNIAEQEDTEDPFYLDLPADNETIEISGAEGKEKERPRLSYVALPNRFLDPKPPKSSFHTGELIDQLMSIVSETVYNPENESEEEDEYDIFATTNNKITDTQIVEHDAFVIEDADVRIALERAEENRMRDVRKTLENKKRESIVTRFGEVCIV